MSNTTLYLKIDRNNEVCKKDIFLSDVSTILCIDKNISSRVKAIKLMNIKDDKHRRYAFSVMKVIELINQEFPNVEVQNIGEPDFIVDYINEDKPKKAIKNVLNIVRICLICLITFIGGAYAIMAYNNDVGIIEMFENAYNLFLGESGEGHHVMEIMYSIGLTTGIIIFYNHFGGKKITNDPTPLEVEMNTLESEIDDALIDRSSKSKEEGNCNG